MITDFQKLLAETARVFDVTPEVILAKGRKKEIALARQVVMALWSDHHSFQDATNRVNRTCHNTAMYARERILNRAELDPNFARIVAGIAARCQHEEPEEKNRTLSTFCLEKMENEPN
jgi:chromosomal replication initiation ATPase DnaA